MDLSRNNTIISKVLRNVYSDLVIDLDARPLVDYLYQEYCLSREEMNRIHSAAFRQPQNRELLDILMTKDDKTLDVMLRYLQLDGTQRIILNLLQDSKSRILFKLSLTQQKGHETYVLHTKWWPEEKPLINNFIERNIIYGEPIADFIHQQLQFSVNKGSTPMLSKKICIKGVGGVGKTTTAKWYANKYQDHYTHVIWIESEGSSSLLKSFQILAKQLNLTTNLRKNKDDDCLDKVTRDVYNSLKYTTTLFIFDNASSYGDLKYVLPKNDLHYSVITSRFEDWGSVEVGQIGILELNVFTPSESNLYLRQTLGRVSDNLKKLGKQLDFLPLALQVAMSTISNKISKHRVSNYLEQFREEIVSVAENKLLNRYEGIINAILKITIKQIEADEVVGDKFKELCKDILYMSAYCLSDGIPLELFENIPTVDRYMIQNATHHLIKYSLVSVLPKFGTLSMHRLLQAALRNQLEMNPTKLMVIVGLMLKCLESDLILFGGHAEKAWKNVEKYDAIVKTFHNFPINLLLASKLGCIKKEVIAFHIEVFRRVFGETDVTVPFVHLQIISVYNSLRGDEKDYGRCKREAESLVMTLMSRTNCVGLIVHAKLLLAFVCYHTQDPTDIKNVLEIYQDVFIKLEAMNYDGKIDGQEITYLALNDTNLRELKLPFRIACTFDYAYLLCKTEQIQLAINLIWDSYIMCNLSSSLSIDCHYLFALHNFISDRENVNFWPVELYNDFVHKCYGLAKKVMEQYFSSCVSMDSSNYKSIDIHETFSDISWMHMKCLVSQDNLETAKEVNLFACKHTWHDIDTCNHFDRCLAICLQFKSEGKLKQMFHLCKIVSDNCKYLLKQTEKTKEIRKKWFADYYSLMSYCIGALIPGEKFEEALELEGLLAQSLMVYTNNGEDIKNFSTLDAGSIINAFSKSVNLK